MNQNQTFNQICSKYIFCQDTECQLDHSRVYVGVCIEYLQIEQPQKTKAYYCSNKDCNLWHFKLKKFKDKKQITTINGIFPHNLCPKNCKSQDCKFIHKEWAEKVCITNIVDECKTEECKFEHKKWDSLEQKAKSSSIIQYITPEQICTQQDCNCDQHPIQLKNFCILYLKGQCPKNNQQCGNHFEWEKINPHIKQIETVKSCIQIASEKFQHIKPNLNDVKLFCKEQEFVHYQKWFYQQNIIDIVFIMDLTKSMKKWKELMQNTIAKIIEQFTNSINGYQVRVAFVGYRDTCDKANQIIYWSFTKKLDELQYYIRGLKAIGGGDYAEDVASGFKQALKLNFSHHPDSILCTFLLADAPCHGRNYHNYKDFKNDNYLDQEDMYLEKVLEKYKLIKKNNFLCCIKINDTTNIMFEKIKTVFPMLIITPQTKPEGLTDQVLFTLRMSVTESQKQKTQQNKDFQYFKASFDKLKIDVNVCEGQDYWKKFYDYCLTRNGETGLKVNNQYLNEEEFLTGQTTNVADSQLIRSSTYIFKAFDAINNREVVIKIPKYIVDKDKITEEDIIKAEQEAEIRFFSSCYACQMAYFFNQRLKENNLLNEMQPLFYAHPILYTLETSFYGLKKVYGETYIQIQYKFEKYTSNHNFSNSDKYFYTAFSHFSYEISERLLVIVDLQGCNNILSDPSIQTDDSWESILTKDKTNKGKKGIHIFTNSQHIQCSYLCEKLKLSKLEINAKIDQTVCPPELLQNIHGICYSCDEFLSIENELIDNVQGKQFTINCQFCLQYQREQKTAQLCRCCLNMFFLSINQQLITLTKLWSCDKCKLNCQKEDIKLCFYCGSKCQQIMKQKTINNELIHICENACNYLKTFKCKKCNKQYNWKSKIEKNDYNERSFICC